MIGGISGLSPYTGIYQYRGYSRVEAVPAPSNVTAAQGVQTGQTAQASAVEQTARTSAAGRVQAGQKVTTVAAVGRASNLGAPVEPVDAVPAIGSEATRSAGYVIPFLRQGMDPAELAVRMRIQYVDPAQTHNAQKNDGKENAQGEDGLLKADSGVDGAQETMEEGECKTCQERKYQDGSDDPGVSYQTPTHISPDQAASAVRGHEMEHVVRERAAAAREDRRVVSQSVTMHTAVCPECGRVYVSGGTTRTVTASNPQMEQADTNNDKK